MGKTKKAKIVIANRRGKHPQGGPRSADMILRAGARGKGKRLQVVHYWPWSPASVDQAEAIMFEAAKREGYKVGR